MVVMLVMFAILLSIVSCMHPCGKPQVSPSRQRQVVECRSTRPLRTPRPSLCMMCIPNAALLRNTVCMDLLGQYGYGVTCDSQITSYRSFVMPLAQQTKNTLKDTHWDFFFPF